MEASAKLSESEGIGEAAYRFLQLLHQRGCRSTDHIITVDSSTAFKAADLQMLKKMKKKINGENWSVYVQWRNLLLLTP